MLLVLKSAALYCCVTCRCYQLKKLHLSCRQYSTAVGRVIWLSWQTRKVSMTGCSHKTLPASILNLQAHQMIHWKLGTVWVNCQQMIRTTPPAVPRQGHQAPWSVGFLKGHQAPWLVGFLKGTLSCQMHAQDLHSLFFVVEKLHIPVCKTRNRTIVISIQSHYVVRTLIWWGSCFKVLTTVGV